MSIYDALPETRGIQPVWFGYFAADVSDPTDLASVVIPDIDPDYKHEDCYWAPRMDSARPEKRDPCLVVFDNNSRPWVPVWWPNVAGGTNPFKFPMPLKVTDYLTVEAANDNGKAGLSADGGWPYVVLIADPTVPDRGTGIAMRSDSPLASIDNWDIYTQPGLGGLMFWSHLYGKDVIRFTPEGRIGFKGTGTVFDTILYRVWAGGLKTDGNFIARTLNVNLLSEDDLMFAGWMSGGANDRFEIYSLGQHWWGDGTNPPDTNLYRGAANLLKTDDSLEVAGTLKVAGAPISPLPPGSLMSYAGAAAPSGWLLCDGSPISRTTYADLFAAIGTAYGAGDGSTTFNLPDMRGRMAVGLGTHADVDARGDSDGLAVGSRRPKHKHTITDPGHYHTTGGSMNIGSFNTGVMEIPQGSGPINASMDTNSKTTGVTVGPQTGSEPTDGPAYLVVNYIIKT